MATVLHIVSGLGGGGAEHTLFRLATADKQNVHHVMSLSTAGEFGPRLAAAGVAVHTVGMARNRPSIRSLATVFRLIRKVNPDVVQTWMYHADLAGGCMARLAGKQAVVWGIRNGCVEVTAHSGRTRLVARACAMLSGAVPLKIVSCSAASVECHAAMGYSRDKMIVVPNGYDTNRLKPDAEARERLRTAWGVPADGVVLGMVARWHPAKDHATLIAALGMLARRGLGDWCCVLVGRGMNNDNGALATLLDLHGVRNRVRLAGESGAVDGVMSAFDVHVLSSIVEAFPNVVAEAMACETPCVVTNVGDAGAIVGETGWVVPPRDAASFADAIMSAMRDMTNAGSWLARRQAARQRVVESFSLGRMLDEYRSVWAAAAAGRS